MPENKASIFRGFLRTPKNKTMIYEINLSHIEKIENSFNVFLMIKDRKYGPLS
jgi:hypothetical protein